VTGAIVLQHREDDGQVLLQVVDPDDALRLEDLPGEHEGHGGDALVVDPIVIVGHRPVVVPVDVPVDPHPVGGDPFASHAAQKLTELGTLRGREPVVMPVVGDGQGRQEVPHREIEVVERLGRILVPVGVAQHGEEVVPEQVVVGLGWIHQLNERQVDEPLPVGPDVAPRAGILDGRVVVARPVEHVRPDLPVGRVILPRHDAGQLGLIEKELRVVGKPKLEGHLGRVPGAVSGHRPGPFGIVDGEVVGVQRPPLGSRGVWLERHRHWGAAR